MRLTLISPTKKETFEIAWAECNTPTGNFIIQPGHAPLILTLSKQKPFTYCLRNGNQEIVMVKEGAIVEITRESVMVLMS